MLDKRSITGRYVGLFLVGGFLFSFPVLTMFNRATHVFGIPLFFLYMFGAWAVVILLVMVCTRLHRAGPGTEVPPGE